MPKVPIYNSTGQLSTQPAGAFQSVRSAGLIDGAVSQAGKTIKTIAQNFMEVQANTELTKAKTSAEQQLLSLQNQAIQEQDLSKSKKYSMQIDAIGQKTLNSIKSNLAKRAFFNDYTDLANKQRQSLIKLFATKTIQQAQLTYNDQKDRLIDLFKHTDDTTKQNDILRQHKDEIKRLVQLGVFTASSGVEKIKTFKADALNAKIQNDIYNQPDIAIERLKNDSYGNITAKQKKGLIEYAEKIKTRRKKEAEEQTKDLQDKTESELLGNALLDKLSVQEISKNLQQGSITPEFALKLEKFITSDKTVNPKTDTSVWAKINAIAIDPLHDQKELETTVLSNADKLSISDRKQLINKGLSVKDDLDTANKSVALKSIDTWAQQNGILPETADYLKYRYDLIFNEQQPKEQAVLELADKIKRDYIIKQHPQIAGLKTVPNRIYSPNEQTIVMDTLEKSVPDIVYNATNKSFEKNNTEGNFFNVYVPEKGVTIGFHQALSDDEVNVLIENKFFPERQKKSFFSKFFKTSISHKTLSTPQHNDIIQPQRQFNPPNQPDTIQPQRQFSTQKEPIIREMKNGEERGFFSNFTINDKQNRAKDANIIAETNKLAKQNKIELDSPAYDTLMHFVANNYDDILYEKYGLLTNYKAEQKILDIAMKTGIGLGLVTNPLSTVVGLGTFVATQQTANRLLYPVIAYANSVFNSKPYDYKKVNGLKELLPNEASDFSKSLADIFELIGLGAIVGGGTPFIKRGSKIAFNKATKQVFTNYKLPTKIYISPEKIKDIFQTSKKITPAETQMIMELGLTRQQYKNALNNGLDIEIPAEKLVTVVDRPYWAKIKSVLKIKPTKQTAVFSLEKPRHVMASLPDKTTDVNTNTLAKNIPPVTKDNVVSGLNKTDNIVSGTVSLNSGTADLRSSKTWNVNAPDEPLTTKRVNKTQIKAFIEEKFNTAIRGKVTAKMGKNAVGTFHLKPEIIRQRKWGELEVTAHELTHLIDKRLAVENKIEGGSYINKIPLPGNITKELRSLDYDQSQNGRRLFEGFAEYMRHYLTIGDHAKVAPEFTKYFNETLLKDNPVLAKNIAKLKKMYDTWYEQGAENRIIQQIDFKGEHTKTHGLKNKKDDIVSSFRSKFIDELYPIEKVVKDIESTINKKLPPSKNPFKMATYLKQTYSAVGRAYVFDHAVDYTGNIVGGSLKDALKHISPKEVKSFLSYGIAKRTLDLAERGIDSGVDLADAKYIIKKHSNNKVWDKALDDITEWSGHLIDFVVDAGGLDPKVAGLMRDLNPIYLPFMRAFLEGELKTSSKGSGGILDKGNVVKGIKGSGRAIINPLESLVEQATNLISNAHKIRVAKTIAELAGDYEGVGKHIVEVPAPTKSVKLPVSVVDRALREYITKELGDDVSEEDSMFIDDMLTFFQRDNWYHGKDNVYSIWMNGKQRFFELSPELSTALKGLGYKEISPVMKSMRFFAKTVRLGATTFKLPFLVRNILKDTVSSLIFSKRQGFNNPLDNVLKSMQKNSEIANRAKRAGLSLGGMVGFDRASNRFVLDELFSQNLKAYGKLLSIAKHPIDTLQKLVEGTEIFNRIPELEGRYNELKKAHPDWAEEDVFIQAVIDAKDVTLNFSKSGSVSRSINMVRAFYNSTVLGLDKTIKAFKEQPVQTITRGMALITVPKLINHEMNKDKQWYKNLPKTYKYSNLFFETGNKVIRIPLPFELGVIFGAIPTMLVDEQGSLGAVGQLAKSSLPPLVPTPTVIEPYLQVLRNKDWLNRNIEPVRFQYFPMEERTFDNTPELAKVVSKAFNKVGIELSPVQVTYLLNAHTGGFSRQFSGDLPFLNSFVVNAKEKPRRQLQNFFADWEMLNNKHMTKELTQQERIKLNKAKQLHKIILSQFKQMRDFREKDKTKIISGYKKMQQALSQYGYK